MLDDASDVGSRERTFFRAMSLARGVRVEPGVGERDDPRGGVREGMRVAHFVLRRFLAKGGMGEVWEAWDEDLRRTVALKFVLAERIDERSMALFVREAHAGGRLAHPSIVTTLSHGTGESRAWIAQELVEGSWTLKDVLDELRAEGALPKHYYPKIAALVAKLADGLEAAHQAGVIHRDVKPQNVMIAPDDTPKLTDFGLARVTDDSFLSETGEFAGTYAYMSPEQVTAGRMGLDHRTDVFSLGIVLYELLTLRRPFEGDTTHQMAQKILFLDPPDPSRIRSQCPRELSVIAGKALEKDPDRRYQTMADLAADLRRHLANEPILAKPPGPITRAVKWSRRNPALSSSGAVGILALLLLSSLLAVNVRTSKELAETVARLRRSNADLAQQTELARANALLAEVRASETAEQARLALAAKTEAEQRTADVLSLSAQKDLDDLVADAERLWPALPDKLALYERWLEGARLLLEGRPADESRSIQARPSLAEHREKLARLRARATPETDEARLEEARDHPLWAEFASLRATLEAPGTREAEVEALIDSIQALEIDLGLRGFANPEDAWWQRQLSELVSGIEALHDPVHGLAGDTLATPFGWGIAKRHAFAREIAERSISGDERSLWAHATEAIRSHPSYGGLELAPQLGLLPLGADPASGLWEFVHLATGDAPRRDDTGALVPSEEMGLVLVLIPGGTFLMGAQSDNPEGPNYDPQARGNEGPPHEEELPAYFISKYEMTQAQWVRSAAENPSLYKTSNQAGSEAWLHPVEVVSWLDCVALLARLGLSLPTEVEWERAARADTETPWWTGEDRESLRGKINLADQSAKRAGANWLEIEDWPDLEDGWAVHAPVGTFAANPFGLHEVAGNVWEWSLDDWSDGRPHEHAERQDPSLPRILRGGGYYDAASYARSAYRSYFAAEFRSDALGLRPARRITPAPDASR